MNPFGAKTKFKFIINKKGFIYERGGGGKKFVSMVFCVTDYAGEGVNMGSLN